jgi:hypothetical protein
MLLKSLGYTDKVLFCSTTGNAIEELSPYIGTSHIFQHKRLGSRQPILIIIGHSFRLTKVGKRIVSLPAEFVLAKKLFCITCTGSFKFDILNDDQIKNRKSISGGSLADVLFFSSKFFLKNPNIEILSLSMHRLKENKIPVTTK